MVYILKEPHGDLECQKPRWSRRIDVQRESERPIVEFAVYPMIQRRHCLHPGCPVQVRHVEGANLESLQMLATADQIPRIVKVAPQLNKRHSCPTELIR